MSQVKISHIANILDITNALNTIWQISWCISIIITAGKLKIY